MICLHLRHNFFSSYDSQGQIFVILLIGLYTSILESSFLYTILVGELLCHITKGIQKLVLRDVKLGKYDSYL